MEKQLERRAGKYKSYRQTTVCMPVLSSTDENAFRDSISSFLGTIFLYTDHSGLLLSSLSLSVLPLLVIDTALLDGQTFSRMTYSDSLPSFSWHFGCLLERVWYYTHQQMKHDLWRGLLTDVIHYFFWQVWAIWEGPWTQQGMKACERRMCKKIQGRGLIAVSFTDRDCVTYFIVLSNDPDQGGLTYNSGFVVIWGLCLVGVLKLAQNVWRLQESLCIINSVKITTYCRVVVRKSLKTAILYINCNHNNAQMLLN